MPELPEEWTPVYASDGYDQYGVDRHGNDRHGRHVANIDTFVTIRYTWWRIERWPRWLWPFG